SRDKECCTHKHEQRGTKTGMPSEPAPARALAPSEYPAQSDPYKQECLDTLAREQSAQREHRTAPKDEQAEQQPPSPMAPEPPRPSRGVVTVPVGQNLAVGPRLSPRLIA